MSADNAKLIAELLPCPWCESADVRKFAYKDGDERIEYVQCQDCTSCGPDHLKGRHWNRRAALSAQSEPIVSAQHDETGRMWEGPRSQIPRRYFECAAPLSAQSEPVAWRAKIGDGRGAWHYYASRPEPHADIVCVEPLYAHPVASAQVPREPTDAMIGAGVSAYIVQSTIQAIPRYVWTAMYDAALAEPGATEG